MGIQRAITNSLSLDVSYVGTHGGNLARVVDINQAALGSGFTAAQIAARRSSCGPVRQPPEQLTRPFDSKFPYLSNIDELDKH